MAGLNVIPEASLVIDTSPMGLLGEGGFGVVRRALWNGTPVAVKSLQPDAAEVGPAPRKAFEREMLVLAHLKHPNVVPVYGMCHHADGRVSLVEELLTGGTLYRRLHPRGGGGGPLAAGEVARVGLEVARALAFAHDAGVTHNDVKSVNVLFNTGGAAVLVDFGLARRVRNAMPTTFAARLRSTGGGAGGLLGTPEYSAPENWDDSSAGYGAPAGDVYSFALLLFEMAVGARPCALSAPTPATHPHALRAPLTLNSCKFYAPLAPPPFHTGPNRGGEKPYGHCDGGGRRAAAHRARPRGRPAAGPDCAVLGAGPGRKAHCKGAGERAGDTLRQNEESGRAGRRQRRRRRLYDPRGKSHG